MSSLEESRRKARQRYYRARADNIKKQVSVYDVLNYYRIPIRTENAEVQYPCPLHGDGRDMGYSARAYPEDERSPGGSTFCWGCQKARDVIQWVMDKETVSFTGAMRMIEEVFGVEDVPNIYHFFDPGAPTNQDGPATEDKGAQLTRELAGILDAGTKRTVDYGERVKRNIQLLERRIDRLISPRRRTGPLAISLNGAARMYYILDSTSFYLESKEITEERAAQIIDKLAAKVEQISWREGNSPS